MGELKRVLSAVMLIFLLIGFNAGFIGADSENESFIEEAEGIGDGELLAADYTDYTDSSFDEESSSMEEISGEEEEVENISEEFVYVDIEGVENGSEVVAGENVSVWESVENISAGDFNESENEIVEEEEIVAEVIIENESEEFVYVDIEELAEIEKVTEDIEVEVVLKELVKDGRVELEFEILEGDEIEIMKKEVGRGEFEKDVLISSDEHFEDEVRVYSDLPSEAREEDIIVTWESEGEIVGDVEYFDLDGDGLIERVSWVVPHLSSQYYSIRIVVDGEEDDAYSSILLDVDSPLDGEIVSNPVEFNISVDYNDLSSVGCRLRIDEVEFDSITTGEDEVNIRDEFSDGNHSWDVECWDTLNSSIRNWTSGSFNVLDFSIDDLDDFYFNNSVISGNVSYAGDYKLELRGGGSVQEVALSGDVFSIGSSMISVPGDYELVATTNYSGEMVSVSESFSVGFIDLRFKDPEIEIGESAVVELYIDSRGFGGNYYVRSGAVFIDGANFDGSGVVDVEFSSFSPSFTGSYPLSLNGVVDGEIYEFVSLGNLEVINEGSGVDNIDPYVELIFPDYEDVVESHDIVFSYEVSDNEGVANCSLEIYNASIDSAGFFEKEDLIFPLSSDDEDLAFEDGVNEGEEIEIRLVDFDEGDYIWEVRCYDDSGNGDWNFNSFSVDLNESVVAVEEANYERKEEIGDLIDSINSFLEKEDSFDLEERKVLEILGLSANMAFWKKRVIQMDQDLKFNLKFMEADKRERRLIEIYEEIDEIESKIVLDIRNVDSYEFSKGSVDLDLANVIEDYMDVSGIDISGGALRSLVAYNEELQKDLVVSVEAWRLELDYFSPRDDSGESDKTREIVLVSKNLDTEVGSRESGVGDLVVLEIIPEEYEAVFVSDVEDVGNGIYSVDASGLEDGNLVYYFEEGFPLKEVEEMESVLFGEGGASGGFSITGMFFGVGDSISFGSFFWLPLIMFIGYVGFLGYGRVRLEGWKREPGVEKMVELINDTNRFVRDGKVDVARDNYKKMGEIYKALPLKCRGFFYKELKKIRLAIDKKDVLGLIREYEAAKDEFRRDDAVILHGKINLIYRKLPKKFQEKVYQRLVKREI